MKITYSIQVCNESRELFSLLSFLKKSIDWDGGDEIDVVVDKDNKTDKVDLVLGYFKDDINVYEREFDNFCNLGKYHTEVAKGDWIFYIDADEMPQYHLIDDIKRIINDSQADIVYIPRINIHPGSTKEWLKEMNFQENQVGFINWPDMQGRLYRKCDEITWSDELHTKLTGPDTLRTVALQPNASFALWHIKSMEKQGSRWKKGEDGTYDIASPTSGNLYDVLM